MHSLMQSPRSEGAEYPPAASRVDSPAHRPWQSTSRSQYARAASGESPRSFVRSSTHASIGVHGWVWQPWVASVVISGAHCCPCAPVPIVPSGQRRAQCRPVVDAHTSERRSGRNRRFMCLTTPMPPARLQGAGDSESSASPAAVTHRHRTASEWCARLEDEPPRARKPSAIERRSMPHQPRLQ